MSNDPLVQFSYGGDNLPPLPDADEPVQPHPNAGQPAVGPQPYPQAMTFDPYVQMQQQQPSTADGIPLFELIPKRRVDGSFENVEFVTILTPGDTKSQPRHKVTDLHRKKYALYYQHWRRGLEMSPTGTPLEMWPTLSPAQVHALKAVNIMTVEQLAEVSDSNLVNIPMGSTLRKQARDWLAQKEGADVLAQRTAEVDALRDGQAVLEKQLSSMAAQMEALQSDRAADREAISEERKAREAAEKQLEELLANAKDGKAKSGK